MKNVATIFCLLLFHLPIFGFTAENIPSTIQKAIVYPNGAMVYRVAQVAIPKGNNTSLKIIKLIS